MVSFKGKSKTRSKLTCRLWGNSLSLTTWAETKTSTNNAWDSPKQTTKSTPSPGSSNRANRSRKRLSSRRLLWTLTSIRQLHPNASTQVWNQSSKTRASQSKRYKTLKWRPRPNFYSETGLWTKMIIGFSKKPKMWANRGCLTRSRRIECMCSKMRSPVPSISSKKSSKRIKWKTSKKSPWRCPWMIILRSTKQSPKTSWTRE